MNPDSKQPVQDKPNTPAKVSMPASVAGWQAPKGVSDGTWDYVSRQHIGDGYDSFVEGDPLDALDRKIIHRYLPPRPNAPLAALNEAGPVVADFGAGTGRTLLPLVATGYRGVAIDLSLSMLQNLQKKISINPANDALMAVQANLAELEGFADHSIDHGLCMLSTLGMIHGREHRAIFLTNVRRMLRPDGLFVVHAHNYAYQLRHPGGFKWALHNIWEALRGRAEIGDRVATYRQVSRMFIHQFRRRELAAALRAAGFRKFDWYGIEAGSPEPVAVKPWHQPFRFVGWVVVAR